VASGAAACPPELIGSTVRAALPYAAGQASGLSPSVAALCQGVSKMLFLARLKGIALGVAALLLLAGLGGALAPLGAEEPRPAPKSGKETAVADKPPAPAKPKQGRIAVWRQNVLGQEEARVQLVGPDGKETTWLTEGNNEGKPPSCSWVALSPDGTQLAYGVRAEAEPGAADVPDVIHVKSAADQKPGRSLEVQGHQWSWSPDGKELVVSRFTQGGIENSIVNVTTGESKALNLPAVKLPGEDRESNRHLINDWSRDGQWLLTTVLPPDDKGKDYLFRVKRDGSKAEPVAGETAALEGRFSPDGKRVLFIGVDSDPAERPVKKTRLYAAEVGKGKPWVVSQELNAEVMGYCWSPDGKRIAYSARLVPAEGAGGETESFLMVVDADGKNPVTLLSEKANNADTITVAAVDWR
jgi:Tol biopolymer transport system component